MCVHIMFRSIYNAKCDIGAVIGRTFQVGQQIGPNEAGLDGTFAVLQTDHMAVTESVLQIVDHLLQRFDATGSLRVIGAQRLQSHAEDLGQSIAHDAHFLSCALGELNSLLPQLLNGFQNVDAVIGNSLKVTNNLQQL